MSVLASCHDITAGRATDGQLHLTGPNRSVAQARPGAVEEQRFYLQGERGPENQCSFARENRLRKGQHITEWVVEQDLTTCEFVLARGEYPLPEDNPNSSRGHSSHRLDAGFPSLNASTYITPQSARPEALRASVGAHSRVVCI